jgi:hypothetical protein
MSRRRAAFIILVRAAEVKAAVVVSSVARPKPVWRLSLFSGKAARSDRTNHADTNDHVGENRMIHDPPGRIARAVTYACRAGLIVARPMLRAEVGLSRAWALVPCEVAGSAVPAGSSNHEQS